KLEMPLVMTEDARMEHPTRVPKALADLNRFDARERIVDMLKERGLLERVEPHRHAVRHCYRCDTVVEPRLSDQWFVKMQPLAALGWPDETPDLRHFYPGHTLVTAPEILFFWVARMLMAGYHFRGARPFSTVYLHGTVRDTQHRKMSKSLGNGIDPLDVVRLYGADALRWTLIAGSSLGADVILDPNDLETTFAPGRNFANKVWNIGRFILAQLPERV